MQVEECDAARATEMRFPRGTERAVGPLRARAAVENAVRVRILPAVERVRERFFADALAVLVQPAEDFSDRLLVPALGGDQRMQLQVTGIRRHGFRKIDEIPVEVDVLLGRARLVREAPGVVRMKEDDRGVLRQARAAAQPGALRRRSGIALDAVRAAADDEYARRVPGAEHRHVQMEGLAARPSLGGVPVTGELGAGEARRFDELAACLGVGIRERLQLSHPGAAGAWGFSIACA